jgi:hypothetical protein
MDNHFKRAVDNIRGGGTYLPVISPDMIGFGQIRRFMLYDFKNKTHEKYRIVFPFTESIVNIAIADGRKRRFIFEIEEQNSRSLDGSNSAYFLQLIDLRGKEVNLIKKIDIGQGSTWVVAHDKVFLWYFKKKEMEVYDLNLKPSQHPLGDAIKSNKNKVDFTRMVPHPSLLFAILVGGERGASFISWGEGRVKTPQPLFSGASQFFFSPDGKWVTFKQGILNEKQTYIMPVSEKYSNYMGTPILLHNYYFNKNNFEWTKNPMSFVASDGDNIYRWELTNEAHPESDKATFHDYVVENDLERLAREKKQGLGKDNK